MLKRVDVTFSTLSEPVSLFEAADPDEMIKRALEGEDDVYCAQVWPSAFAATFSLLRELVPGSASVIELGCGPGLPSLAALAAGAPQVTATDWSPLALALTEHAANSFQPGRAERLDALRLDIFSDAACHVMSESEVLVAADLLYDEATAEALGRRAVQHVQSGGRAIIADPGRPGGRAAFARGVRSSRAGPGTAARGRQRQMKRKKPRRKMMLRMCLSRFHSLRGRVPSRRLFY